MHIKHTLINVQVQYMTELITVALTKYTNTQTRLYFTFSLISTTINLSQ